MAIPKLDLMWANYPTADKNTLFDQIGWSSLKDNKNYANTCAIRMSLCLIRCGLRFSHTSGGESIQRGGFKGAKVEVRQDKLSDKLAALWGPPEKFTPASGEKIAGRKGVVSFFGIPGYTVGGGLGGHIDLIKDERFKILWLIPTGSLVCAHDCHFDAQSCWFWPAE